jgi:YebC/PmpR family DNA-binding regulatory protein
MSGHSKWSTIKHKKAKTDAQRGKVFTKVVKEIIVSAKEGGGDPEANARLRLALQKAKEANMPNDNIKRAIQKGTGEIDGVSYEEIIYEGYAQDGVALLIEALTDNKNRTLPNVKSALTKGGGSLASKGAVAYLFDQKGLFVFEPGASEDQVMEVAIDAGAEDVVSGDDGSIEVITAPSDFEAVKKALDESGVIYVNGEVTMIPKTTVKLDEEKIEKVEKLIERLEDDDDVQNVYANYE